MCTTFLDFDYRSVIVGMIVLVRVFTILLRILFSYNSGCLVVLTVLTAVILLSTDIATILSC